MQVILCAFRSVWHYRRINFVVASAVAIATTVIGGSLIVGDSVRYSLRRMTEQRLGDITDVLAAPVFFRQQLADDISVGRAADDVVFVPAILVTAGAEAVTAEDDLRRVGSVAVAGIDDDGWQLLENGGIAPPRDRGVVLGYRTAEELGVTRGDEISLWVDVPASIPRDSLLGDRDDVNIEIVLSVQDVIPETVGASRFDLNPGQQLPYNAFMALQTLQERLGLEEIEASRRDPVGQPGRVNTILVGSSKPETSNTELSDELNEQLASLLTVEDLSLRLRLVEDRNYISVETDRMILSDTLSDATLSAAADLQLVAAPSVVYLSNEIFAANRTSDDERYSMYSILAGLDFDNPEPLGRFRQTDGSTPQPPGDGEIVLSAWLAEDLEVEVGDQVTSLWHEVGSQGELPEIETRFTVSAILAADDPGSVDSNLTPYVKGVTDVESFDEVDQPFPMKMNRLTKRDDAYWDMHRATPKAFVSLGTGEELWKSRYGTHTSIRVALPATAAKADLSLEQLAALLSARIPQECDAEALGLRFQPVLADGLKAAVGANDFTQLFIGFSFFLIASALILASLMFRLGLQQRIQQFGLFNALGWPRGLVQRLFLTEGIVVASLGAGLGTIGAVLFGRLMIYALTTWWIGAVGTRFLSLDVQPVRLLAAAVAAIVLTLLVIWHALRSFAAFDVRSQLAGDASATEETGGRSTGGIRRWADLAGFAAFAVAVISPVCVLAGLVPRGEAFAGLTWPMVCFFVAGLASLGAGLHLLTRSLQGRRSNRQRDSLRGLMGLALTNTARNPMRTRLTTALVAFATFVIVAVGAGRRNPLTEVPDKASGNGGFTLVAESAQPVLADLNTEAGRAQAGMSSQDAPPQATIFPFSVRPGSDASCVNLYQTRVPTLLGAPDSFIERGGFRFADTRGENPWENLRRRIDADGADVPVIPVIGDANTLTYSLKKGIGSRIPVPDADAPQFIMEVVGKLDGSVFQGVLITTDDRLKSVEHEISGAEYFLIETEPEQTEATAVFLESQLRSYGFDTESVNQRIAGFLAVQNTYLSTFQMLGGLGLLVGTFGLAAVMLRNVIEREGEFALLTAIGFRQTTIGRLIVTENCVLLCWGIFVGSFSALLAMSPHLVSSGGNLPWVSLATTLVCVMITGLAASWLAVKHVRTATIREGLSGR